METKSGKIKLNIISTILCQVVTIAIGFILPLIYIENFGSETNGILSVIKQIFTYLTLLEAGIGVASAQALYKPVAENARGEINSILAATTYFYRRTGLLYFLFVSAIAGGYGAYIAFADYEIGWYIVVGLVFLNALPSLFSYFVQLKYQVFLEIDGRQYILTNSQAILQIVSGFAKIAVILLTNSLLMMQLTYAVCALAQLLFVTIYTRKKYPWLNFKVPKNTEAVSQKGAILIHQITSMVFNNTDIILISFLCNPVVASIYYVYNLFFTQVETFITGIIRGFNFALGQLFHIDKEQFEKKFSLYEMLFVASAFLVYTLMSTFLLPIIRIYTQGERDGVVYVFPIVVLLFALSKMISAAKTPCGQIIEYAGCFRATRWHAIVEMVINIVTTVVCVITFYHFWGNGGAICGALCGTVAASLFRGFATIIYTNKFVLKRNPMKTFLHWIVNIGVFGIIFLVYRTDTFLEMDFWTLFLHGVLNVLWIVPAFAIANFAANPKLTKDLICMVKEKLPLRKAAKNR